MNDSPLHASSLRSSRQRVLAGLAAPFNRLDFAINNWATRRLLERGPAGVTLRMLADRLAGRVFRHSTKRVSMRSRLQEARTIDELIDRAGEVLFSNQKQVEIAGFLAAVRETAPRCILEIGVAVGGTNLLLSRVHEATEFVVAIDLYVRNKAKLAYFAPAGQTRLVLEASSYAPSTVKAVAAGLGTRKLDLLFIDGDHTYQGARADFEAYSPFVREGGLIAFHDIVPDELTRSGTFTGNWVGGVPTLWRDIKSAYPEAREFVADPEQDGFGIGMIRFDPNALPRFRE